MLIFIADGIIDFITSLKFGDFWWFIRPLLLVMFSLGSNWGFEVESGSHISPLWDPGPSSLGFCFHGSSYADFCSPDSCLCGSGLCGFGSLSSGSHGSTWLSSETRFLTVFGSLVSMWVFLYFSGLDFFLLLVNPCMPFSIYVELQKVFFIYYSFFEGMLERKQIVCYVRLLAMGMCKVFF
jgi:hypothetical protein